MNALQHTPLERKFPMRDDSALCVLPIDQQFPEARLIAPSASGFVLLAAQVDRRPPFLGSSARKRKVLQACKRLCLDLRREPDVLDCTVFRAIFVPPGSGGPYLKRRGSVHKARFDVVVLVEMATVQLVERLVASEPYRALDSCMRDAARDVYQTTASNVKRIGPVDHSRDGVFLFNFFVTEDQASRTLPSGTIRLGGSSKRRVSITRQSCCRCRPTVLRTPSSIIAAGIGCATSCRPSSSSDRFAITSSRISMRTTRRRCQFSTGLRKYVQ